MTRDLALAELRRSVARNPIDKRFMALVVLSAFLHYGSVAVVRAWDAPRKDPTRRFVDDSRPVHWAMPAPIPKVEPKVVAKQVPSLAPKHQASFAPARTGAPSRARFDRASLSSDPMLRILSSRNAGVTLPSSSLHSLEGWEPPVTGPRVPSLHEGAVGRHISSDDALHSDGPGSVDTGDRTSEHPVDVHPTKPLDLRPEDDATSITGQLQAHMRAVRTCYDRSIKVDSNRHGRMLLRLSVDGAGDVSTSVVEDTVGDGELSSCVARRMTGWTIRGVRGPTSFRVPLIFVIR